MVIIQYKGCPPFTIFIQEKGGTLKDFEHLLRKLGERVRYLRKRTGLTQAELSERAGIYDVGEIERGKKIRAGRREQPNPTLDTLFKLARALGVEIRDLFDFPCEETPSDEQMDREILKLLKGKDVRTKRKAYSILKAFLE